MPKLADITVGAALPERDHQPDEVQLFLYNAALWNAHRIHFDERYATEVEGYPGLVVPGPLMGDWLTQCVLDWLGDDGRLARVEYSNRRAAYLGQRLRVGGTVTRVDRSTSRVELALWVRDESGETLTPGSAIVELGGP